jgi:hypothetical protein
MPGASSSCSPNPRRKLAVVAPLAVEAVKRIDAIFDQERMINGAAAADPLALRQATIAPLVVGLEAWMRGERAKLSRHAEVARAIDYLLKRWPAFSRFLDDGRICITNNAAERALRGLALGRKSWLFCGSDRAGERAAVIYSLIGTAKLNGVDRRPGSLTCSPASTIPRPGTSPTFSRGTGTLDLSTPPPDPRSSPEGYVRLAAAGQAGTPRAASRGAGVRAGGRGRRGGTCLRQARRADRDRARDDDRAGPA